MAQIHPLRAAALGALVCTTLLTAASVPNARPGARACSATAATLSPLGAFRPTFYRILDEASGEWPKQARTAELLDPDGHLIARVTPAFRHQLDIEGSGRLRDGRIVNFEEKHDGAWRFYVLHDAPYGIGENRHRLVPFRTIAVDPHVIQLGAVLYAPALRGIRLPSGEVHDGYVFADDTGQGIDGHRIDVFVGYEVDVDNTFTRSGRVDDMKPTCLYQVDPATAADVRRRFQTQYSL